MPNPNFLPDAMSLDPDRQQIFESCVDQCADSMYRVAFRLLGDANLAQELVQETYLNAWKSIGQLRETDRMRAWMFSILRNQYTKLLTRETRAPQPQEEMQSVPAAPPADHATRDAVQQAIEELDEKHKLPVLLVSMEGLSVDQAAEILDVPRGTVLSRLHRGRAKLKQKLALSLPADALMGESHGV